MTVADMMCQVIQGIIQVVSLDSDRGRGAGADLVAMGVQNILGAGNLFRRDGDVSFNPGLAIHSKENRDCQRGHHDQGRYSCQIK